MLLTVSEAAAGQSLRGLVLSGQGRLSQLFLPGPSDLLLSWEFEMERLLWTSRSERTHIGSRGQAYNTAVVDPIITWCCAFWYMRQEAEALA